MNLNQKVWVGCFCSAHQKPLRGCRICDEYFKRLDEETNEINNLPREEMARIWRFAPSGHIYFDSRLPFFEIFRKRFDELGGFSPEISKKIDEEH